MIVPLISALALVIAAAKFGGWAANRLGQPAVLGELLAGLLLGPSVFNVLGQPYFEATHVGETLHELGELGVIFLMFTAGLEIQLADLIRTGKPAVGAGVVGVIVPIGLGVAVTLPFQYSLEQGFFLGIVLAATSVSISAQTLMELGRLRSREGLTLLGAAVVDDVLAIAVLSAFVALTGEGAGGGAGGLWSVLVILARMVAFLAGAFLLGAWLLPRAARWAHSLPVSEALMSFVVVIILAFAWASEVVGGVAAITGAFLAGVALAQSSIKDEIERGIHTLTYAFFVPIFLVNIGLTANVRSLSGNDIGFTLAICGVAIVSKLLGAGLGAKLGGMAWPEAWRVGVGMISRGEVGLIVAGVGVSAGLLTTGAFTTAVVMVLVTTLITPLLLRWVFRKKELSHG